MERRKTKTLPRVQNVERLIREVRAKQEKLKSEASLLVIGVGTQIGKGKTVMPRVHGRGSFLGIETGQVTFYCLSWAPSKICSGSVKGLRTWVQLNESI